NKIAEKLGEMCETTNQEIGSSGQNRRPESLLASPQQINKYLLDIKNRFPTKKKLIIEIERRSPPA
ncbi:MAG: hypothetical protein AAB973_00875, partial [Patescibacteria group bacterium]